ncbi:hypothetical protein QBC47DRAFT_396692 [Echria macrotheca]|uniref:Uncharacterized protein n=1 Tax=Echria macrotheca TaxID=438768 RepID=A0AAJ0BMH9_9PEZI|nr:hypothetical protein QBC47DRAFT_396692 [Echria macrotheca]
MAAKFERASQEHLVAPSPARSLVRHSGVISQYTVNPPPDMGRQALAREQSAGSTGTIEVSSERGKEPNHSAGATSTKEKAVFRAADPFVTDGEFVTKVIQGSMDQPRKPENEASSARAGEDTEGPRHDNVSISEVPMMEASADSKEPSDPFHHNAEPGNAKTVSFAQEGGRVSSNASTAAPDSHISDTETYAVVPLTPPPDDMPPLSPGLRGSNVALHAQIRSLQKQLAVRSEEVNHLRRLLEAKIDTDSVLLRERLRITARDCALWRERAEKAERLVAVYEQRLITGAREHMVSGDVDHRPEAAVDGTADVLGILDQGVDMEVERWLERTHMEENGADFGNRIRQSLGAKDAGGIGSDGLDAGDVSVLRDTTGTYEYPSSSRLLCRTCRRSRSSTSDDGGRLSATAARMWIAAEEMLGAGTGTVNEGSLQ